MRSSLPKVLHPVCGRPMVAWPVLAAREAGAGRVAVIVSPDRDLAPGLPDGTETVVQPEADGTGGAVRAAHDLVRDSDDRRRPLRRPPADHRRDRSPRCSRPTARPAPAPTVMTVELDDPGAYGRIVRDDDGDVERIVETKHPEAVARRGARDPRDQHRHLRLRRRAARRRASTGSSNDNAAGEYYLGDVLPLLREQGLRVVAHLGHRPERQPRRQQPRRPRPGRRAEARRQILERHMLAGVTIVDPGCDLDRRRRRDRRRRDDRARHRPARRDHDRRRRDHRPAHDPDRLRASAPAPRVLHSYLVDGRRRRRLHRRPVRLPAPRRRRSPAGAKAGTFVEIKNSEIGAGRQGPAPLLRRRRRRRRRRQPRRRHDHRQLRRLAQAPRRRSGKVRESAVNTSLVAPVSVGDDAYTGAGAVIREDVPAGALGVSSDEQRNIEGYAERKARARRARKPEADRTMMSIRRGEPAGGQLDPAGLHEAADGLRRPRLDGARRAHRRQARRRPRPGRPAHLRRRRGLLPLRGVDPRRRRLPRPVDRRQQGRRG